MKILERTGWLRDELALLRSKGIFKNPVVLPIIVTSILLGSLLFIAPYWQTNDDAGMSMRAHGYGSFHEASPNLIFSNVIWGYIVSAIPEIRGYLGYSIATYSVLSLSAGASIWYLTSLGANRFISAILVFFTYFYAFVFPQFTVNSGLAGIVALLALISYSRRQLTIDLFVFSVFSYLSFIIRWNEFSFVIIVCGIFSITYSIISDRKFLLTVIVLFGVFQSSSALNNAAYAGASWDKFRSFGELRAKITDYGIGDKFKGSSKAKALGFSDNDFDLLKSWFFVDEAMTSTQSLRLIFDAEQISTHEMTISDRLEKGAGFVMAPIRDANAMPFVILLIIMSVIFPSYRIVLAFIVFAACQIYLGFEGRSAMLRVYYPALAGMLFLGLVSAPSERLIRLRKFIFAFAVMGLGSYSVAQTVSMQARGDKAATMLLADMEDIDNSTFVTWGARFPYELLFSPLDTIAHKKNVEFYSLGASTYAPTSRAFAFEVSGINGFVVRFTSINGINFIGYNDSVIPDNGATLSKYCSERHKGSLVISNIKIMRVVSVINAKCILT